MKSSFDSIEPISYYIVHIYKKKKLLELKYNAESVLIQIRSPFAMPHTLLSIRVLKVWYALKLLPHL